MFRTYTSHGLKENINETVESFLAANNVNHETRKAMIQLQLRPENSKKPYPATQKSLAMKLHYWSASSYERLRQSGMQLPHTRTVEKWIAEYAVTPGFLDQSLKDLEEDLKLLPPEGKCCIVKFDEMAIKEFEEYSSKLDVIVGFEDLGPLGRTQNQANHVFVFTLNEINPRHKWRTLAAYFYAHNYVKGENIKILLLQLPIA